VPILHDGTFSNALHPNAGQKSDGTVNQVVNTSGDNPVLVLALAPFYLLPFEESEGPPACQMSDCFFCALPDLFRQ